MGDDRHKKSPPEGDLEIVTEAFRQDVRRLMLSNRLHNETHGYEPGHPKYRPADHADLANAATGGDKMMISKIIGPAKATTKMKLVKSTRYLAAIRAAMEMEPPAIETISVPAARAETLRRLARLPDDLFEIFESRVNELPD